jgi:uncharacterized DUF497 family protein
MKFEWHDNKNVSNIEKHGISFEQAIFVFKDLQAILTIDNRFDYGETRFIIIGEIYSKNADKDILIVVVYTKRKDVIRIISARKANKKEKKVYEQERF